MRKTTQSKDISVKILKNVVFKENILSYCVNDGKFPNIFTQANIIPVFKKGSKETYGHVSFFLVMA